VILKAAVGSATPGKTGNSDAFRSAISVPRRENSLDSNNPHAKTRGCEGATELFHAETPRSPRGTLLIFRRGSEDESLGLMLKEWIREEEGGRFLVQMVESKAIQTLGKGGIHAA
jgi:hypothetical protein